MQVLKQVDDLTDEERQSLDSISVLMLDYKVELQMLISLRIKLIKNITFK